LRASAKSDDVIAAAMACPGSRSENYEEVYEIAKNIKIPCLIVHGTKDETIPIETSRKISSILEDCIYVEIKEADHPFSAPSHYKQMFDLVSEFILKQF
jgi:dipeptidyl aminopeptidase/acylaminoacyl peptidase